jgi:hypothetical protein
MHVDMPCFDALDPNVARHLLWDTLETLTPPGEDNEDQQQTRDLAVAAMLEGLAPATALQAMVASHIVALHHGALGCYRWAMQTDPATPAAARLRRDPMAMTRTMMSTVRELHRMQRDGAPPAPPAAARAQQCENPMPSGGVPGADAAWPSGPMSRPGANAGSAHDLARRERGKTDWHSTRLSLRALEGRDLRTLTDDELEARMRALATPDDPYDPSWRVTKPPPPHPRWETLTPEERRARYGWRSEEEIEAERAAEAAAAEAAAEAGADQPLRDPPLLR